MKKEKRFKVKVIEYKGQKYLYWYDKKTKTSGKRKLKKGAKKKLKKYLKQRTKQKTETPERIVFPENEKGKTPTQEKITQKKYEPKKTKTEKKEKTRKIKTEKKRPKIQSYFKNKIQKKYLTSIREIKSNETNVYKKLLLQTVKRPKELKTIINQIEKSKHYLEYELSIRNENGKQIAKITVRNKTLKELAQELDETGITPENEIGSQDIRKLIKQYRNYTLINSKLRKGLKATIDDIKVNMQFIRGTV